LNFPKNFGRKKRQKGPLTTIKSRGAGIIPQKERSVAQRKSDPSESWGWVGGKSAALAKETRVRH